MRVALLFLVGVIFLASRSCNAQASDTGMTARFGGVSAIWWRPLTVMDYVLTQVRSDLSGDADVLRAESRAGQDTGIWLIHSMELSVEPKAFVEPDSSNVIVELDVTIDSLRQPARRVCNFVMMEIESAVAAGATERKYKVARDNMMSHLVPPTFYVNTSPVERRAAYDTLQSHMRLRAELLEMAYRRLTTCERAVLSDSLTVVTEHLRP